MKLSWRHLLKKIAQRVCEIGSTSSIPGNFPPTFGKRLASSTSKVSKGMLSGRMTYLRMVTVLTEETKNELLCSIQPYTSSIIFHTPSKLTPLLFKPTSTRQWSHSHTFPPCFVPGSPTGRYCLGWWGDPWKREACPSRWTWCSSCAHSLTCPHLGLLDDGDNNKQSHQARQAIEIVIRVSLLASHCHRLLWRPWLCSSKIIP